MITRIYHISDIHIRLFKRHKEYEQVFKRLFQYINETKTENSIIFLGGDIVHNKTDMTPELIDVTSRFFKGCADLLPTILIAGNHDANISNLHRLDALTPIVSSLNHPNLHYWRESGVYKFGGLTFSVFGLLDGQDKWVPAKDIKAKYKIALHHGPIIGSRTESQTIETGNRLNIFDGFDVAMLGDIHSPQILQKYREEDGQKYPEVIYPGSLISQNYGESVDNHGIYVWDLPSRTAEFVTIKNDYGFITFNLVNGKCDIPNGLPKNLRVRVKFDNTTNEEVEAFVKRLGKKYNIVELIKQKSLSFVENDQTHDDLLGNSRDVDFQNGIIKELLHVQNPDILPEEVKNVLDLNFEINKLLPVSSANRNVTWKPLVLEFSNMFSYGEDNIIDFSNFSGNYGLFSKNAEGKSSIFDILTFVLYDKSTRANKASHILNNQKNKFQCKLSFELGGRTFLIERIGTKNEKTGAVKVDVNFWSFDDDGERINLNGEDRDKTNYVIRDYVGTYDDFVMTALSTQYDNQNFVEKSQRDRKELLYKFLDIFVYDELYKIAKENSKEYQILIRDLEKENLHQRSSKIYSELQEHEVEIGTINNQIFEVKTKLKEQNNSLNELNKQYRPIDLTLDIGQIELKIKQVSDESLVVFNQIGQTNELIQQIGQKRNQLLFELQPLENYSNLIELQSSHQKNELLVRETENKIKLLESELKECRSKELHLSKHEYDPNCKFCVDNQFVKSAKDAIERIPVLSSEIEKLHEQLDIYKEGLTTSFQSLELGKQFQSLTQTLNDLQVKVRVVEEQQKTYSMKNETLKSEISMLSRQKDEYNKNVLLIEKNKEILNQIDIIKHEIDALTGQEQTLQKQQRKIELEIGKLKQEYDNCNERLDKYLDYIKKYRIYELYMNTVSRDGVPYKIVEMVLPVLENEVNLILNSVANFNIKLEATDEKYVHAFIQYGPEQVWPVELASGMERFVLSLAFRVALTELTSLPKSNFLAIDEGFGVLDSENILQIGKLFQYLKNQYDHIICISHIDSMRDLVDNQISINKEGGFSKIRYVNGET